MESLILTLSTYLMMPILLMMSFFLFVRGHNAPGGGFIAGLMTSAALCLFMLTYGTRRTREVIRFDPKTLSGVGLLISTFSGVLALFDDKDYMKSYWFEFKYGSWHLEIGTPILFDLGVYFVVIGMVIGVVICLSEA